MINIIDCSKFGLNQIICPFFDLKTFFKLAKELGLNWVELRNDITGCNIFNSDTAREIRSLSNRFNIRVCSINALQQFNYLKEIYKTKEQLNCLLDLAEKINCPAIVMCPMNRNDDFRSPERQFRETVSCLKELAPLLKKKDIQGYIEPLGFETSSLSSIITAMKAIREVRYEGYKIVFDTFHHAIGPDNLEKLNNEYDIKLTGIIHVSAITTDISKEKYKDEHRNIDFKNDKLRSKEQVDCFIKSGYNGIISFEPFARDLQELDIEELKNRINKAIKYLLSNRTI